SVGPGEGGARVGGVLEFDHGQGQAVDVEDDVEAAFVVVVQQPHLVDGAEGVGGRVPEVDEPDGGGVLGLELVGVGQADSGGEVAVCEPVLRECFAGLGGGGDRHHPLHGGRWQVGVEAFDRVAQVVVE